MQGIRQGLTDAPLLRSQPRWRACAASDEIPGRYLHLLPQSYLPLRQAELLQK